MVGLSDNLSALSSLVGPAGSAWSDRVISAQSMAASADDGVDVRRSRLQPPWSTHGKPPKCGQVIYVRVARGHICHSSCLLAMCAAAFTSGAERIFIAVADLPIMSHLDEPCNITAFRGCSAAWLLLRVAVAAKRTSELCYGSRPSLSRIWSAEHGQTFACMRSQHSTLTGARASRLKPYRATIVTTDVNVLLAARTRYSRGALGSAAVTSAIHSLTAPCSAFPGICCVSPQTACHLLLIWLSCSSAIAHGHGAAWCPQADSDGRGPCAGGLFSSGDFPGSPASTHVRNHRKRGADRVYEVEIGADNSLPTSLKLDRKLQAGVAQGIGPMMSREALVLSAHGVVTIVPLSTLLAASNRP